jgi:hypothetical protein
MSIAPLPPPSRCSFASLFEVADFEKLQEQNNSLEIGLLSAAVSLTRVISKRTSF